MRMTNESLERARKIIEGVFDDLADELTEPNPPEPALKPCAHCDDGKIEVIDRTPLYESMPKDSFYWICSICGVTDRRYYPTRARAITAANQRPPLPEGLTEEAINDLIRYDCYRYSKFWQSKVELAMQVLRDRL